MLRGGVDVGGLDKSLLANNLDPYRAPSACTSSLQPRFYLWCYRDPYTLGTLLRHTHAPLLDHPQVLKLSLPDLTARAASGPMAGRPLGGLVYADTFIDLPAAPTPSSAGPEGAKGVSPAPRLLVLTEGVPALVAVPVGGAEEAAAGRALRSLARVVGGGGERGQGRVALWGTVGHVCVGAVVRHFIQVRAGTGGVGYVYRV